MGTFSSKSKQADLLPYALWKSYCKFDNESDFFGKSKYVEIRWCSFHDLLLYINDHYCEILDFLLIHKPDLHNEFSQIPYDLLFRGINPLNILNLKLQKQSFNVSGVFLIYIDIYQELELMKEFDNLFAQTMMKAIIQRLFEHSELQLILLSSLFSMKGLTCYREFIWAPEFIPTFLNFESLLEKATGVLLEYGTNSASMLMMFTIFGLIG